MAFRIKIAFMCDDTNHGKRRRMGEDGSANAVKNGQRSLDTELFLMRGHLRQAHEARDKARQAELRAKAIAASLEAELIRERREHHADLVRLMEERRRTAAAESALLDKMAGPPLKRRRPPIPGIVDFAALLEQAAEEVPAAEIDGRLLRQPCYSEVVIGDTTKRCYSDVIGGRPFRHASDS